MKRRIWNVRLNVDELNAAMAKADTDADRAALLSGMTAGLNGRPDAGKPGFWADGWAIGTASFQEAERFSAIQRERVQKRYHGATVVDPRYNHGATMVARIDNRQSTIEQSTNEQSNARATPEPEQSIFGEPQEPQAKPFPDCAPDATLPPRLREAFLEIAVGEGGGKTGYSRASRTYLAAKRLFRAPTTAQMLATYRIAADSEALDSDPSLWPDFREKTRQEKRQERTGSTATLDDSRRDAYRALDARLAE